MEKGQAKRALEAVMNTCAELDDGSDGVAELKLLHIRSKLKYLYPPSKEDEEKMAEIFRNSCARVRRQIDSM